MVATKVAILEVELFESSGFNVICRVASTRTEACGDIYSIRDFNKH